MSKKGENMQEQPAKSTQSQKSASHKIELDHLHGASMTGITSVPTFTDKTVTVKLKDETLVIVGQNLEIKSLDVENGRLTLSGRITSLKYSASAQPTSVFKRIFK